MLRDFRERIFDTQQAMADAANEHLAPAYLLTGNDIGKLERRVVDRPSAPRCKALRTICGVTTDAEIGLVRRPRTGSDPRVPAALLTPSPLGADYHLVDHTLPGDVGLSASADDSSAGSGDIIAVVDGDWNSFSLVTSMLAQQRQTVAPEALLSLVEAHRDCLSTLFRRAQSDPLRYEIGAMLGEASIVSSRLWSAQGNRSIALAHCACNTSPAR